MGKKCYLRFSERQLVLSAPDGSTVRWNLFSDGNLLLKKALGPQLNAECAHQLTNDSDTVSWFPFRFDAGLWAYVDGTFISFQGKDRFVTIIDVGKLVGSILVIGSSNGKVFLQGIA